MFRAIRKAFGRKSASQQTAKEQLTSDVLAQWTTVEVDSKRIDLFSPIADNDPAGCVLFLHGHGRVMLNDNTVFSQLLQEHNLAAICPDGKRSWWLNRVCSEFDSTQTPHDWIRETVIPLVEEQWGITSPHIALLGISMGGQGALQLAFSDARQFPVVAAIAPAVDFHQLHGAGLPLDEIFEDLEDARQHTVVLNLHPLAWPRHQFFCCDPTDEEWFDGCVRLGMKLSSSGILHERDLETSAGGHSWDYFNHMAPTAIQHIADSLNKLED